MSPRETLKSTVCCCLCGTEKKKGVESEGLGLEMTQSPGEETSRHFGPALVVIHMTCIVLEGRNSCKNSSVS